ncbi:MAG: hypothetical protein JRJ71_02120 [Deltaproteobacteria bacterium]|nr:hypothetical protein [Deltaproteobacteria bacterium]
MWWLHLVFGTSPVSDGGLIGLDLLQIREVGHTFRNAARLVAEYRSFCAKTLVALNRRLYPRYAVELGVQGSRLCHDGLHGCGGGCGQVAANREQ